MKLTALEYVILLGQHVVWVLPVSVIWFWVGWRVGRRGRR